MYITAQGHRLRNDLYCVEWDVKLYYTIPYPPSPLETRYSPSRVIIPVWSLYRSTVGANVGSRKNTGDAKLRPLGRDCGWATPRSMFSPDLCYYTESVVTGQTTRA